MKPFNLGLVFSGLLLSALSVNTPAGIIYNWYDVTPDTQAGPITASIEFDESVWSLGGAFKFSNPASPMGWVPYFGVNSISFASSLNSNPNSPVINPGFTDPIKLSQSTCGQVVPAGQDPVAYCAGRGHAITDPVVSPGLWEFDLIFGEFLQGSMTLNDLATSTTMSSQGSVFTITQLSSDSPGMCYFSPPTCMGGTGNWRLQVTEPSTVLLLAVGFISLAVMHRRRKRAGSDKLGA